MRWLGPVGIAALVLVAAPGASSHLLGSTWTGTWNSDWGVMTLTQTGSKVVGKYVHDDGRIVGTASGGKFKGRWTELPTRKGPSDAGAAEFTMSRSGKAFTGRWTYD